MTSSHPSLRQLILSMTFLIQVCFGCSSMPVNPVHDKGLLLKEKLMSLNVETLWLPNSYVEWRTGAQIHPTQLEVETQRLPYTSHCSAYVASAAERLGIELLNPETSPSGNVLLANRQNQWLRSQTARNAGWRTVDAQEAQAAANRGEFVIASLANSNPRKPGHIAIVLPDRIASSEIARTGPSITQAGSPSSRVPSGNSFRTTTASGFYLHARGSLEGIEFFSHLISDSILGSIPGGKPNL